MKNLQLMRSNNGEEEHENIKDTGQDFGDISKTLNTSTLEAKVA